MFSSFSCIKYNFIWEFDVLSCSIEFNDHPKNIQL